MKPGDDKGGDEAGYEASQEDGGKPDQTKDHCLVRACTTTLLMTVGNGGNCLTVATGDVGEVVAKKHKEDDLKEGGDTVHQVP